MGHTLILFAHPAFQRSRINKALVEAARALEGVYFHDLYEAYPDFDIDVRREQALLAEHELIVLQHPFYWYSTPALLKEWQDLVLEHGWAYGKGGEALRGKRMLSALTTGGPSNAYTESGFHGRTVRSLLAPIEQTATLCGMRYVEPFVVYATLKMPPHEMQTHAERYAARLQQLSAESNHA